MSKNDNVLYLDKNKDAIQSEKEFPDFIENRLKNDIDRHLFKLSLEFKTQIFLVLMKTLSF